MTPVYIVGALFIGLVLGFWFCDFMDTIYRIDREAREEERL
jgi:hypothetical protein